MGRTWENTLQCQTVTRSSESAAVLHSSLHWCSYVHPYQYVHKLGQVQQGPGRLVGHLGPPGWCRRTGRDPKASARGLNRLCLDRSVHKELWERSTRRLSELRTCRLQDSPSPSLVDLLKSFYAKARTSAAEKDPSPNRRDLLKSPYAKAPAQDAADLQDSPSPSLVDLQKS
jgi:hypothetical protein